MGDIRSEWTRGRCSSWVGPTDMYGWWPIWLVNGARRPHVYVDNIAIEGCSRDFAAGHRVVGPPSSWSKDREDPLAGSLRGQSAQLNSSLHLRQRHFPTI